MPEYTVHFNGYASTWAKVSVDSDDPEEIIEVAINTAHVGICHQCAREVDIGDYWEPNAIYNDESNELVWTEERPAVVTIDKARYDELLETSAMYEGLCK